MNNEFIFGAIDIGSNAVRLLINTIETCTVAPKKVAYMRVPIRLGEDVFQQGQISPLKANLLTDAMQGFAHIMKAYNVLRFRACATSAMRDAENSAQLVTYIKKQSGITVEIIDGTTEASLIYKACSFMDVVKKEINCLYVDVGGGSTEIVIYAGKQHIASYSFQIGTVRMLNGAIKKEEIQLFADAVKSICKEYAPEIMIASGGNINKTHKLLNKKKEEPIAKAEIYELYKILSSMSLEKRMDAFGLNNYRADVIIPALSIFSDILTHCASIEAIHVPKVGLADGVIYSLYTEHLLCP